MAMDSTNQNPDSDNHEWHSLAWKPVLALIAIVLMAALVLDKPSSLAQSDESSGDARTVSGVAFLGGVKRKPVNEDFRGGDFSAVMGGIDIDLRDATMDLPEAVLDISTVMGGARIRVPRTWTVVSRVDTVLGGFEDNTRHPENTEHRLVLKGTVVMGGLKVTN